MMIWLAQESNLSWFPLNVDHPRGIFLLGWRAAGWVMGQLGQFLWTAVAGVVLEDSTVKAAQTEFA